MAGTYPDSICSTVPDDVEEFASSCFSPRDPIGPNIRNVVRQVQACIENTSLQLRNDYKHKQAVYQAWSPAASGVRPVTPLTPRSKQNRIAGLGSSGSLCGSPRSSISSLWAGGQQAGLLQHQQGHPVTLPSAASFADFFAARRSGDIASSNSSSLDPFRLQTCTAGSTSSLQQSRVQDARNYAAADSARPQCPLMPGSMLEPSAPPNTLLLEKLRQQACQQDSTGQHNITPNPTRSQGSGTSSGSLATPVSAHSRCGMFDTASLGELSLWGEPLNVSPVSPQRSARAAGLFPASAGGHAGRQQLDRPASPTVLSTFATDCNIAPAVVATSEGRCSEGQDGSSPFNVARPHSMGSSAHRDACCRGRSCSPTAYRSEGAAAGCRPRSLSPSPRQLICCRCRRQHSLQQHSSCCHLCGNCCQARGSCASSRGDSSGSSNRAGCGTGARAAAGAAALSNIQRPLQAELSTSSSTSTCACIKAYRIGQRDMLQQHRAVSATAAAAAAAGGVPNMDSVATESPADAQQPGTTPPPAAAAAAAAAASPQQIGMPEELLSTGQAGDAAPAQEPGSDQPDLVQVAFNEVYAAQQNLLNQGAAADPQDIEELSHILQQVLAAAEPQHEEQLREVLGQQQRLLSAQEAYLAETEVENERVWPELPPLRLPSGLAQARVSTASAGAATLTPPQQPLEAQPRPAWDDDSPQNWALQHSRLQQQHQDEVMGDAASTRSNSSGGNSAWQQQQQSGPGLGGVDGLRTPTNLHQQSTVFVTQQHLQRSMAPEDRLAAAAAAYEAAESGGKPLQQLLELNRGKAGTRSSRGGRASIASSVTLDAGHSVSHQDSQQLYRQQQEQAYSRAASMKQQAAEYDGAAPAYTADSCSGSELDLEDAARSLLHCMGAQGGDISRQVVQDAPNMMTHAAEVQGGQALVVPRTGNGAAAPTQPTAASAGGARTPSNRSIADSAYSVQAVPAAALYGQQEVRCSSVTHATATPQQLPVAVGVTAAPTVAAFGVAAAGVNPVVPPLSFDKNAALAGTAVDGRVLGLSPSLKEVEAAGNLQELAEAISGGGAGLDSSGRNSRAPAAQHALGQRLTSTGTAPSPRTPRVEPSRLPVDAAAGVVPGGSPGAAAGHQLLTSSSGGGSTQSHRMASVRFRSDCFESMEEAAGRSGSSTQAHPTWASDPRQPELSNMQTAMRQQQQVVRRSASGRAGSFELPDSAPSSQEHSCRPSIEGPDHDRQAVRPQTGPRAAATTPYGSLGGFAPAAMPPQDMSGLQQGAVPQQQAAQDMWSPQSVALQRLQHSADSFQSAGGGLNNPIGGAGRPGRGTGQPQSPGSCQVPSPRVSLAAAATAAAAVAGGSTGGAGSWGGFDDMRSLSMERQKPPLLVSTNSAGVASSRGSFASRASQAQQQPQQQQQQQQQQQPEQLLGISSAASISKSSATSWRERQLAMQQELTGQQQQLQQIRSRASSVATTPRGPSMLRSVSRASGHSSIASSAAMLRIAAEQCPQQDQNQQQQQHNGAQLQPPPQQQQQHHHQVSLAVQQQQQQQEVRPAAPDVQPNHSPGLHGSVGYAVSASPCSPHEADRDHHHPARRQTSSPLQDMLDSIMADRLQERRAGSTMRTALRGWRQYTAARKAKGHHTGTGRRTSKGDSTAAWMQQGQSGTTAASSSISSMSGLLQAAAGKSLRISLQGINSNVLRQSLGMLQGQLDAGEVEGDTVDIVVSGQLCLQRSPSPPHHHHHPQQQVRQPAPQQQQRRQQQQQQVSQRQHRRSSSANGGCDVVRHFDEQLQATKAAVAAASAGAGRAPLQSVLREMQSMIARMEAVCCRDEAPGSGRPLTQQAQQECKQSAATQAAQGQQPRHLRASPAHNGHSSSPDMPPRAYCNQRRPGSAGSITDWQQQAACCSPAFARSRSPRRQLMVGGQGGKLRSPDRHKLRGRLHTVQDRLARLEVKMHQAASMSESPCPCVSPQRTRQQQASWGAGGSSRLGDGSPLKACWGQADGEWVGLGARGCSLEGKKQVLVGRMQQELEDLQQELQQLQQMMPDAYSSGSS